MIDIIYKTLKPLHLKKLQITQNIKNLMFQVTFILPDWILIKANHSFFLPFLLLGEADYRKNYAWGNEYFSFCLGRDDKNMEVRFEWRGA